MFLGFAVRICIIVVEAAHCCTTLVPSWLVIFAMHLKREARVRLYRAKCCMTSHRWREIPMVLVHCTLSSTPVQSNRLFCVEHKLFFSISVHINHRLIFNWLSLTAALLKFFLFQLRFLSNEYSELERNLYYR